MRRLAARWSVLGILAVVTACGGPTAPATDSPGPPAQALDLVLRNSGFDGGFVHLAVTGQPTTGRWHAFGMAELVCLTCSTPFGRGPRYDIVLLDDACRLISEFHTVGGDLSLEIDPGPSVALQAAPPPSDWMPADSPPMDGPPPCTLEPAG